VTADPVVEDRPGRGRPPVLDVEPPGPPVDLAPPPFVDVPPGPPPRRRLDPPRRPDGTVETTAAPAQLHEVCAGCGAVVAEPVLHGDYHDQLAQLRADVDQLAAAVADLDVPVVPS
jgi:hypothetical protein